MRDTTTPEFQAELVSSDGQNMMVRHFLIYFDGTEMVTIGDMIRDLKANGWEEVAPYWVNDLGETTRLTYAHAQGWLRWMFALEQPHV